MLKRLELNGVGPAPRLEIEFSSRLNLFTGDNGLGKSFVLDVAWWALTRSWSGYPALPSWKGKEPAIEFAFSAKTRDLEYRSTFDRKQQVFTGKPGRPANPGLVLYARVDGGFSLWDPARNYWRRKGGVDVQDRPPAYHFAPDEIWDGLHDEDRVLSNGLIQDWTLWQKEKGANFELLQRVLKTLSPSPEEELVPGLPTRISLDDVRDIPTIRMPYGQDVPVLHASAGMKRVLALAYLLVWAWQEHQRASELLGQTPASQIILLVDEIEAHLHPRWQRLILRSLLEVVEALAGSVSVQLIGATHSPLILASVEPDFQDEADTLYTFDLVEHEVRLEKVPWRKRGDASSWLVSEVFDLPSARSVEAEQALGKASEFLSGEARDPESAALLDQQLRTLLSDTDPFWARWRYVGERQGWLK